MTDWLTPADVARSLQVSRRTVLRWIDAGSLPALRVGSVVRISRQALAVWQGRHETAAPDWGTTEATSAPAATVSSRNVTALPPAQWPEGYVPVYGGSTTAAASSAAGRDRIARRAKSRPA